MSPNVIIPMQLVEGKDQRTELGRGAQKVMLICYLKE